MSRPSRGRPPERTSQDDVPESFWRSVSYIDTVEIVLMERMDDEEFKRFWASRLGEPQQHDPRYRVRKIWTTDVFYFFKVVLHQPSGAELLVLSDMEAQGTCKLTRVHVALDLHTRDGCSPDELRRHIESRLVPTTRARHFVRGRYDREKRRSVDRRGETTYYFRPVPAGVEIALYSDRHSKAGFGWQCCHLEFRIKGAKALEVSGLSTLGNVYSLDHRKFWDSKLEFWRPPTAAALARCSNGAARSRTQESLGDDRNQRHAHAMIRLATHHHLGLLNAYQLLLELHKCVHKYHPRPLRMFQKVDHTWALPSPRNYMWPVRTRILAGYE